MSRRDKLSRQLGDPHRRKRRNIEVVRVPVPGYTGSSGEPPTPGGGTEPDGCPNIGPPESGAVFRTSSGTGDQKGHEYTPVLMARLGLDDCTKTISYCFCARVGPSTSPSVVSCNEHLGRIEAGLLAQPLQVPSLRDWSGDTDSARVIEKDGRLVYEIYLDGGITYAPSWWAQRDNLYVQAKHQYEGTAAFFETYVSLDDGQTGRISYAYGDCQQVVMNEPYIEAGGAHYQISRSYNLFSNQAYSWLNTRENGHGWRQSYDTKVWYGGGEPTGESWASVLPYQPIIGTPDPVFWSASPGWVSCTIGLASGGKEDSGYACGGEYIWPEGLGRAWWWDLLIMKHHKVFFQGIPEGYFVILRNPYGGPAFASGARSREGASASGELEVWPVWRGAFGDYFETFYLGGSADETECGGTDQSYPCYKFELYDGDPCDTGSLVEECTVNEGFYGGDVWVYSTSGLSPTGTVPDVYSTIRLNVLNNDGDIMESYEPTGANTVAWSRTGYTNITLPNGAAALEFVQWKRGDGDGWGEVDDLQVNVGDVCCPYSPPQWQFYVPTVSSDGEVDDTAGLGISPNDVIYNPATGDAYAHVTRLWSETYEAFVTADELYESLDEHRQGAANLLTVSRDERATPGASGAETGDAYPDIVLADHGIEPEQKISLRFQAKREA